MKFIPGDRVRVYYDVEHIFKGVVMHSIPRLDGLNTIRVESNGKMWTVLPQQCRKLRHRDKPYEYYTVDGLFFCDREKAEKVSAAMGLPLRHLREVRRSK